MVYFLGHVTLLEGKSLVSLGGGGTMGNQISSYFITIFGTRFRQPSLKPGLTLLELAYKEVTHAAGGESLLL